MESFANSRKLNGISLVECLQNEATGKENQSFPALVRSPKIDQSFVQKYQQSNAINNNSECNPVSKVKSFFNKLRGSSAGSNNTVVAAATAVDPETDNITANHANIILNDNQSSLHLSKPTTPSSNSAAKHTKGTAFNKEKRILIPSSYSTNKSYSKYPNNHYYNKVLITSRPKKKKIMMISPVFSSTTTTKKNYHLPTISTSNNTKATKLINNTEQQQQQEYRRKISLSSSNSSSFRNKQYKHRHTLDLSCYTAPITPANATTTDNALENTNGISTKNDSKIELLPTTTRKRANSFSFNTNSIYSTFTSSASSTASSNSNTKSSNTATSSTSSSSLTSCSSASFAGLKRTNNTMQNITELLPTTKEEIEESSDANDYFVQKRLWNEDITLCQKEEIAQWLGSKPAVRSRILYLYMSNFNFSHKRLDEAFRILCLKLYLKGETQQLDRIIEAFAKRYFECNPTSLLHCVDVVYAVAYSLLLLNTDLHVADTAEKMTKNKFLKNTIETIQTLIFPHLKGDEATEFVQQKKRRASILSHQSNSNDSLISTCSSGGGGGSSPTQPFAEDNNTMINKLDAFKSNISWKTANSSSPNNHHGSGSNGLTRIQKAWLADIENLLKDMYTAVKSHSIHQAAATAKVASSSTVVAETKNAQNNFTYAHGTGLYRSRTLPKKSSTSSNDALTSSRRKRRGHSAVIMNLPTSNKISSTSFNSNVKQQQVFMSSLSINSTNGDSGINFKEGLVMRKHVMENADKRARHRQWQLCYLAMNETTLTMYKPIHISETLQQDEHRGSKMKRRKRKSLLLWNQSVCSLQGILSKGVAEMEDWKADLEQVPFDTIEMNHTYASAIPPPGWNGQRPHVFQLETADGGLWLFESIDMFAIQAWVQAANFTASKISKGPLTGAVCNIDYGWGSKWDNKNNGRDDMTSSSIPVWYPPTSCMVNSTLSLKDQYQDLEAQIAHLNQQLNDHRQLKLSLDKKFNKNACPYSGGNSNTLSSMQALTNWDKKLHYILHELIKLNCYKESIHGKISNM